jgi:MFS family permease
VYVTLRSLPDVASEPVRRRGGRVASTVILLGTVSLLTDVSSEMVNAVLPLYLTAQVGLGVLAYGFVDGWYQGVSALVRIAGGYAGDRGGSPKWVATFGYALSAVSRIALLPAHGFAAIVGVITADRLGKGVRTAPRDALIADASEPSVLGRAFGVHRAMDTVGATLGPIVAFLLLLAAPGYGGVFVVSFAFAIVGVAVIVLFVPNLTAAKGAATTRLGNMLKEMARPRLRRLLVAVGLLSLVTVGDGFLYLSLQQRDNMAGRYFPLLFVGTNTAYFLLAIPLGRLADRVGRSKVFLGGYVALVAAYLAAGGPLTGVGWTLLVLLLLGTFYAATDGVLSALVSPMVAADARGTGIASAQTVVALARFGASMAFGALWVTVGRSPALLVFAAVLTLVIPLAAWLLRVAGTHAGSPSVGEEALA